MFKSGNFLFLGNRDKSIKFLKKVSLLQQKNKKILVSNDPETISIYRGFYNQNFDCSAEALDVISNNQLDSEQEGLHEGLQEREPSIVFFDRIQTRHSKTDTFYDFLNFHEQFNVINILTSELLNYSIDILNLIDTVIVGFNNLNKKTKKILIDKYNLDETELDKHLYEAFVENKYLVVKKDEIIFIDNELNVVNKKVNNKEVNNEEVNNEEVNNEGEKEVNNKEELNINNEDKYNYTSYCTIM